MQVMGRPTPSGVCAGSDPWYFNGRPFGNSGPGRRLRRESSTQRIAGSVDGDFLLGRRDAHWDIGVSYSRAKGNLNLPAVYTDRIFRAFRCLGAQLAISVHNCPVLADTRFPMSIFQTHSAEVCEEGLSREELA